MNLLMDANMVKELQESINLWMVVDEPWMIWKLGKHALHTGQEMWLIVQIRDYEMDQVILELGSNTNVLPKQT